MRRFAANLLIAVICLLWAHCTTLENSNPIAIVPPGMVTSPAQGKASVQIVNNSSYSIYYLNISSDNDTSWQSDRLGASTIAAGASFSINNIPPGVYDLRVQTSGHSQTATRMSVSLTSGQNYVWTVTSSSFSSAVTPASIKVVNNSSYSIYYLNISSVNDTSWQSDQLGSSTIISGSSFTIDNIPPGKYDLRVQTSGHSQTATRMSISLTGGQSYVWTVTTSDFLGALTMASLKIVNNSSYAIYNLYVSSSSSTSWGSDQLGSSTISTGSSFTINSIQPGTYDFKVTSVGSTYSAITTGVVLSAGNITTWTIRTMSSSALDPAAAQSPPFLAKIGIPTKTEAVQKTLSKTTGWFLIPESDNPGDSKKAYSVR